jgi:hypothetical protein
MKMRTMNAWIAVTVLGFVVSVVSAADKPDATLRLSGGSVAAGIGYSWGGGTLTFKGKTYDVEVSGLSVGDVGVSKIEASGDVFNLKRLEDFDGNFTAAAAGATIAGGATAVAMRNQNGVTVNMISTTKGLKWSLAAAGVSMKIKK